MSNSLTASVLSALRRYPGHNVFITVGNSLRSDDGVGPYISSVLENLKDLSVIAAGQNPENVIDKVAGLRPARILIIDAADFGKNPGYTQIVDREHIPETSVSTHAISLKVIAHLIEEDTGVAVEFLGIQPQSVELKEGLSPQVKETADAIIAVIRKEFSHA
ncbi:MAG: hydrogenase maturation peptidase HycI [Candidatus Omnitrophica bacterium]|nr:hydrogenase maturation peptidase HycI [Candidatus Omnitrophota bacterium]